MVLWPENFPECDDSTSVPPSSGHDRELMKVDAGDHSTTLILGGCHFEAVASHSGWVLCCDQLRLPSSALCHTMLWHAVSALPCLAFAMPASGMLCHEVADGSRHAMLCYATPRHAMPCYAIQRCAVLLCNHKLTPVHVMSLLFTMKRPSCLQLLLDAWIVFSSNVFSNKRAQ